jgi:hypothetical protein
MFGTGKKALDLAASVSARVAAIEVLMPYVIAGEPPSEEEIMADLAKMGIPRDVLVTITSLAMLHVEKADAKFGILARLSR